MSDSNPMHRIGYGRGDDVTTLPSQHKPRMTQSYSFIDPQRVVNVGESKVEPTVPMQAISQSMQAVSQEEFQTLSVRDVISRLIERNVTAWKSLPLSVRGAMVERAHDFQFIPNSSLKEGELDINILYNGVVWKYRAEYGQWVIHELIR
jgi:hypothetical protein